MKFFLLLSGLITFYSASASACVKPGLGDFLVYATDGITADSSDYQGLIGSRGNITLSRFHVTGNEKTCLTVTTTGNTSITDGKVELGIESLGYVYLRRMKAMSIVSSNTAVSLEDASVDGKTFAPHLVQKNSSVYGGYKRAHINMHASHEYLPDQISALSEGWSLTTPAGTKISSQNGATLINVLDNVSVMNTDASLFRSELLIKGDSSKIIVFNIKGADIKLADFHVYLEGMKPYQVLFNFPEAVSLSIRNTGNSLQGLPGTVLAPAAVLDFVEGLITGQVLVRRINPPMPGENSGQVNQSYFFRTPTGKPNGKQ